MNVAYPDPSTPLAFEFKINRQADIYFTLLQDGVPISSVTGWTWALSIKRYPGSRTNLINLTLGNGLTYDTYSDIVLHAHLTSSQCNIDEGEYFIQLTRTDIEKTWIEGPCFFRFAKNASQEVMSSELTLDIASDTQDITINVISGRIINVGSTTSLQTAYDNGKTINIAQDEPIIIKDKTGNNIFHINTERDVTFGNVNDFTKALSSFSMGLSSGSTLQILHNSAATSIIISGNNLGITVSIGVLNLIADSINQRATPSAITDGATISFTKSNHTLTTEQATISVTDSFTGDYCTVQLFLSGITQTVLTFVTGTALCDFGGTESGDNTMTITGVSGDRIEISRKKTGTNYSYIGKNFGQ